MSIKIGPPAIEELRPRIAVIGVGGAGGNAIANMIRAEIEGVQFVVANTDAQSLNISVAEHRIQLGPDITQGLGAGSRPEVGRAAAEETLGEIERTLDGAHMVFIAAGMGGGTGTGAAPVIAKAARDKGVLTVGVVTKPFLFEGTRRMRAAEAGIEELQKNVDTLIVIPNQNLFLVAKADTTFKEAFHLADEVLQQGVRSITDLMVMPGLINLDFADVRSVMAEMGKAMMGTGEGSGENRALEAAEKAIANPLLDGVSMQGAKGVIISIIGGDDMKLLEVDEAANHIRNLVDPQANIIWGSAFNPDLQGRIRVSVVATGIEQSDNHGGEQHSRAFALQAARGPARPEPKADAQPAPAISTTPPLDTGARPFDPPPAEPEAAPEPAAPPAMTTKPTVAKVPPAEAPFELGTANEIAAEPDYRSSPAAQTPPAPEIDAETPPVFRARSPLDASPSAPVGAGQPMLDATRLSGSDEPTAPATGRRRSMIPQDEPGIAPPSPSAPGEPAQTGSASGGTLFERMANFTARRKPADGDDDDDEGGAISIPRFLGRQNNQ